MKRQLHALLLFVLSCAVLFAWKLYRCNAPDFEDMVQFDPSVYACTYALQSFKLKSHDRNWTLSSVAHYKADGEVEWETVYHLDEDGQAYYMNNEDRIDVAHMPRKGFGDLADVDTELNVVEEEFDQFGRLVSRKEYNHDPRHTTTTQLYYCTDSGDRSDDDAISTYVSSTNFKHKISEEPVMYVGREEEPAWESTSYNIINFDKYGNETGVWLGDEKCFLQTSIDGYLQTIIIDNVATYIVKRVDESGRPLWSAVYGKEDGILWEYTVWNYKELS